jgi:tetratricopeptide (TPR) repeat protein
MMRVDPGAKEVAEKQYRAAIATSPKRQELFFRFAEYYMRTNRKEEGLALLKQAVEFDPEIGDSHWMYGLSLLYDAAHKAEGAKELVLSQTVKYRFKPVEARQFIPLIEAAAIEKNDALLKKFADQIVNSPVGPTDVYLQFVSGYQKLGYSKEAEAMLDFITRYDPAAPEKFEELGKSAAAKVGEGGELTR